MSPEDGENPAGGALEQTSAPARAGITNSNRRRALARRLAGEGGPLILDGATGTELERAGLRTGLPLWSTHALLEAPEAVFQIHAAYLAAGAEILTANTFRTQHRTLARAGLGESDARLTRLALDLAAGACLARRTAGAAPAWIAGSLPPLEDCYRPDLVPPQPALAREHGRQAELLGEAGADLILVETMSSEREALAAARAAAATGLPFVVSFVAWDGAMLLSGEPLQTAAARALEAGASAVGVNCLPIANLAACQRALAELGAPLLFSPNLGQPEPRTGFARDASGDPRRFPEAFGASLHTATGILGGCCGTTPAEIAALVERVRTSDRRSPAPNRPTATDPDPRTA